MSNNQIFFNVIMAIVITCRLGLIEEQLTEAAASTESNGKCPVCFMRFPSRMTSPDKIAHVEEHFAN